MNVHETSAHVDAPADDDNVVMFRPRKSAQPHSAAVARMGRTDSLEYFDRDEQSFGMERFPVDIRGNVTFGRLMSGLATVGLTVRVDARSGRVIIADESTG